MNERGLFDPDHHVGARVELGNGQCLTVFGHGDAEGANVIVRMSDAMGDIPAEKIDDICTALRLERNYAESVHKRALRTKLQRPA